MKLFDGFLNIGSMVDNRIEKKVETKRIRQVSGARMNKSYNRDVVKRLQIAYWVERKWRQKGDSYFGKYQTAYGSWLGKIVRIRRDKHEFYIYSLPKQLDNHSHRSCFTNTGHGDEYSIHFSTLPADIDSGIIAVEQILTDACGNN